MQSPQYPQILPPHIACRLYWILTYFHFLGLGTFVGISAAWKWDILLCHHTLGIKLWPSCSYIRQLSLWIKSMSRHLSAYLPHRGWWDGRARKAMLQNVAACSWTSWCLWPTAFYMLRIRTYYIMFQLTNQCRYWNTTECAFDISTLGIILTHCCCHLVTTEGTSMNSRVLQRDRRRINTKERHNRYTW